MLLYIHKCRLKLLVLFPHLIKTILHVKIEMIILFFISKHLCFIFQGLITGLGKGVIGTVTKPVAGVLDLASGAANAVKDTSSSTSHVMPDRVRLPRCCHGPGGLLPAFLENQAVSQQMLYQLNRNKQEET